MNENCVQAPFRVTSAGWQMEQCPYSGGKAVHQMNENCVQAPFRVTGAGWQMEQCPYSGGKAVHQMNENCVQAPFRVTGAGWQMEQCPYAGGKAVYQARAILSMVNDTIEYFDDAVCLQSGIYRQSKQENISKIKLPEITIIPNPAKDYIEVRINGNAEGLCYISILNLLGENTIVQQMSCDEKVKRINISNLVPGVYTVRVLNNKVIKTSKLVISR